jgi:tRNA U34 2-thiouridine synthase MnmA/TrmU
MDRALIVSYLKAAEEQVANGVQDIADQRDLISTLERTGHTATSAIARLREMEKTQTRHIADRERLRAELAELSAAQLGNRRRIRRTPFGRR